MKIKYDFFNLFLERFGRMHKNSFLFFSIFWRKPGISIPDLYLYSIKIQSNIDQNEVKILRKITNFFEIIFENFFLAGPSPAHVAGLDPVGLAGSLAQTSDPAGQEITHAIPFLLFKWIIIHLNSKQQ